MKVIIACVLILSLLASTYAASFSKTATANNSKELAWMLEGGNDDLFLVHFFMPGDQSTVKAELEEKIAGNSRYGGIVTYIEINAARTSEFREILEDIGIYRTPARMYPYVLLVKKGEGYLFRGSNVGELVSEKITQVIEGRVDYSSVQE